MGVLWLLGPSGVGKSTVGWLVWRQLPAAAYVDADQLGLCYPAPAGDAGNHRLKARALAALHLPDAPLVVSGGVEDAATMRAYLDLLDRRPVTLCRLRVGAAELRARIAGRGGPLAALADAAVAQAAALDRTDFADVVLDTGGRTAAETASAVLALRVSAL